MVDSAELTPAELDRIEDALEELDDLEGAFEDASPLVQRRLASYREILRMSRVALPLQEVPAGVLDGVLEHARASADATVLEVPHEAPRPSWWERWRTALLVPGVAVATAALVVVVINGSLVDKAPEQTHLARSEAVEAEVDKAEADSAAAAIVREEEKAEGSAEAAAATALEDAPMLEQKASAKPEPESELEPEPAAVGRTDGAGSPRWDIVARGDRARRDGDCKRASAEYAMALTDEDAHVRARAYAGLGLCDAVEGRYKEASDRYQRAKELDPQMESFIDDQRPVGAAGGGGKANRAKRAAPRAAAPATSSKASSKAKPVPQSVDQAFE
jgi:tetratricopeptide (TPR) repeat protein